MDQQKKLYKTEQDLKKQLAELKKQKASLEQIQTGIQTFMKSDAYTGIVTVLKITRSLQRAVRCRHRSNRLMRL